MVSLTKEQQVAKDVERLANGAMQALAAEMQSRAIKHLRKQRLEAALKVILVGFQLAVFVLAAVWMLRHWA